MFEDMVDVLIYLYENYMDGDAGPPADQRELKQELVEAGFATGEIDKALVWLDRLADKATSPDYEPREGARALRVYTVQECERLDVEARGLLLFLEQNHILDPVSRELVVDQAMCLDTTSLSVEELKWIVLLVLMNRPGQEAAFSLMETMVYNDPPAYLH